MIRKPCGTATEKMSTSRLVIQTTDETSVLVPRMPCCAIPVFGGIHILGVYRTKGFEGEKNRQEDGIGISALKNSSMLSDKSLTRLLHKQAELSCRRVIRTRIHSVVQLICSSKQRVNARATVQEVWRCRWFECALCEYVSYHPSSPLLLLFSSHPFSSHSCSSIAV